MARKHIKQMSKEEIAFVHGYLRAKKDLLSTGLQSHFYDRASERKFTPEEAKAAVAGGVVIEIHNDRNPDVRCLVRNSKGTCAVVSLISFEILTVYYNAPDDNHDTLNWNAYRWNQNMVELIKSLRRKR
jgi:hypothetical protein